MVDIMCLRQAYERRKITEVKQIRSDTNLADAITKVKCSDALQRLIDTNTVKIDVIEQVERDIKGEQIK